MTRTSAVVSDLKSDTSVDGAPVLVALAVMVFWGATPVLTRIATDDLDPLWVAVLRTVLAGVVAAPLVVTTERRPPSTARPGCCSWSRPRQGS